MFGEKSSLSIFAFKLTCWLANGQTAWWTSIKTQWQSHSFWKSRYEVIWVLCHGRSADRSVCTAFAAMPSRIQGISRPTTWWGINLSETDWKVDAKMSKGKKNTFHTSLPGHIVGGFWWDQHTATLGRSAKEGFPLGNQVWWSWGL